METSFRRSGNRDFEKMGEGKDASSSKDRGERYILIATPRPLAKAQTESKKKGNNCSVAQSRGGPHIHRQTLEPLVETKESANEQSIFRFSVDSEERNSLGYRKHPWRDG